MVCIGTRHFSSSEECPSARETRSSHVARALARGSTTPYAGGAHAARAAAGLSGHTAPSVRPLRPGATARPTRARSDTSVQRTVKKRVIAHGNFERELNEISYSPRTHDTFETVTLPRSRPHTHPPEAERDKHRAVEKQQRASRTAQCTHGKRQGHHSPPTHAHRPSPPTHAPLRLPSTLFCLFPAGALGRASVFAHNWPPCTQGAPPWPPLQLRPQGRS